MSDGFLIFGIVFCGMGIVAIVIGFIFRIPYKNVRRFANHKVQGQIVDMVWNGAAFNEPRNEAAGVNGMKIAGVEIQPGTRYGYGIKPITGGMCHKVYRYMVNGVEYLRADGVRYDYGTVKSQLGKQVMVYYNPQNPQESTISNGMGYKITMIALFSLGGLVFLLGIGALILGVLLSSFL